MHARGRTQFQKASQEMMVENAKKVQIQISSDITPERVFLCSQWQEMTVLLNMWMNGSWELLRGPSFIWLFGDLDSEKSFCRGQIKKKKERVKLERALWKAGCRLEGAAEPLTMAVIQKWRDRVSAAWRPRLAPVQVGKHGCHHVGIPAWAVKTGTLLSIIMRHVKHVACKAIQNLHENTGHLPYFFSLPEIHILQNDVFFLKSSTFWM